MFSIILINKLQKFSRGLAEYSVQSHYNHPSKAVSYLPWSIIHFAPFQSPVKVLSRKQFNLIKLVSSLAHAYI